MFDVTLQIGHMDVLSTDDHITLTLHPVFLLPVGNGNAMPVPFGVIRVPMAAEAAAAHAEKIRDVIEGEGGEGEPPKKATDLVVAQNLSGIDRIADQDKKLRGQ